MDYSSLIHRALAITRRHRFLWLLALFAGSSGVTCSGAGGGGPSGGSGDVNFDDLRRRAGPEVQTALNEVARWVTQNLGLILAVAAVLALLLLVLVVISVICQGALAHATVDLALDQPSGLRRAFAAGRRLFWRYVGLSIVLFGITIAVLVLLGIFGAALWLGWRGPGDSLGPLLAILGLFGGLVFAVLIVAGIVLGVIVAYAQRAIAAEDVGPVEALRAGWRLLWTNKGASAMAWLMGLVMSIAAGLVIAFGVILLLITLGIVGAILFATTGVSIVSIGFAAVAGIAFFFALIVAAAAANAFLWTYWTLVYLHLMGRLSPKMEPIPAPA